MDSPLLVRRDEVEDDLLLAVGVLTEHGVDGLGVDRGPVEREGFAEIAHPLMVLIKLLPPRERAPGDQFGDVQIAGIVGLLLALDAGPGMRGDNLAGLRDNVAEADLFVLAL